MTTRTLWVLLALCAPLVSEAVGPPRVEPVRAASPDVEEAADLPAVELPEEGLWAWISRMQGEMVTEVERRALEERSEEKLAEGEAIAAPEVPTALYEDPVKATEPDPLRDLDAGSYDIPVVVNADVKKWIRYFTGRGRKYAARWLSRSSRFRPYMYQQIEKRGMPRDLVYLSMIESGYNAYALSHAGAAGLWQFMPATGRMYKLRVDWWIDERRDPHKSTVAALHYLRDLHRMFDGDWYLAFASYNAGPGRVRRAIARAGTRDFWKLQAFLPDETAQYVPKMIAAAIIGHNPEFYGFSDVKYQSEFRVDDVKVDGSADVEILAEAAGISTDDFKLLNPSLRRWATPPSGHLIHVPAGTGERFAKAVAKIPKSERIAITRHKVRKGETLSRIAGKYGVPVSEIQRVNGLKNANRIYVGMNLTIPRKGGAVQTASASAKAAKTAKPVRHTVTSGESLSSIAKRYGVTLSNLKSWNRLEKTTIHPGQVLAVSGAAVAATSPSPVTYEVKRGDSLFGIAKRYGVAVSDLERWNKLKGPTIHPGQRLVLHVGEADAWVSHTVKRGESLGLIAERYGCSVKDLMAWNTLEKSTIFPGQKLRLKR